MAGDAVTIETLVLLSLTSKGSSRSYLWTLRIEEFESDRLCSMLIGMFQMMLGPLFAIAKNFKILNFRNKNFRFFSTH